MKYISLLILFFSIGCSPLKVATTPTEKLPLNLAAPDPLKMRPIKFLVITKESAGAVFDEMERIGQQPVLFGLSGLDYKSLSVNIKDIQNFLSTQQEIIILYKSYYEPAK